MTLAQDIKAYAEKSIEDAKTAAAESRKPFYAFVGANDFALEQSKIFASKLQEQAEEFTNDFSAKFAELREEAQKTLAESREKAQELPGLIGKFDLNDAKKAFEDYSAQVVSFYGELSVRGAKVLGELSKEIGKNPVFKKVVDAANEAAESTRTLINRGEKNVKETVADSADAVIDGAREVKKTVRTSARSTKTTARKTTARKSTATPATAKKTPAKTATASQAPAKTATASEAPAKTATASEAPAKSATAPESPAKSDS